jgi:hypothetical protein
MPARVMQRRWYALLPPLVLLFGLIATGPAFGADEAHATDQSGVDTTSDVHVIQQFTKDQDMLSEVVKISDHEKQIIMFSMGIALLIMLVVTAVLGISMAVYGKQVFIPHMVFAGLSVTLALAHAVVAIVWFFPF